MPSAPLLTSSSRRSLTIGGFIFILLTVAVFSYQFYRIQAGDDLPRLNQLRWTYLILILCFLPLETLVLGLRMWIMCRVLQPGISFWTCFEADLASSGIALLTPSQIGGGPGQIYILNRGGARLGTALNASLLAFVGTMLALLGCGLYALFVIRCRPCRSHVCRGGYHSGAYQRRDGFLWGLPGIFPGRDRRRFPMDLENAGEKLSLERLVAPGPVPDGLSRGPHGLVFLRDG